MPHDAFSQELKVGDRVMVPCTVVAVYGGEEYCNVALRSVATMQPDHTVHTDISAINTAQCLRANEGDDLAYEVKEAGTARIITKPGA